MAEIKPRINLEGRTPLQEAIPIETPYLVFLDPSSQCNASCRWCPTGRGFAYDYRPGTIMGLSLYSHIIDKLSFMPDKIKTLRLYKDGEPLLNKNLPDMIRFAKGTRKFGQIDTTTNGFLLTPAVGESLVDAGLDIIFVSVPATYTARYRKNLQYFLRHKGSCKAYVKTIGDFITPERKTAFLEEFCEADRIFIENLAPCWPGFDVGKVGDKGIYGNELSSVTVCPYIFYSLAINADGTVSLCFLDWKWKMILGDLRNKSFYDIWNGLLLRKIRMLMLMGQRESFHDCGSCGQLIYGAPDNIDPYAEDLLKKFE